MTPEDRTPLERLEEASIEIEELATGLVVRARAFGAEAGARNRIALVQQRLKIAHDELHEYPWSAADITDE